MRWWGNHWENQALKYLRGRGLKLLARNYTCPAGEVDLVMRDGNVLVFVEVRYRKGSAWVGAAESVTPAKQRKVAYTAAHFLQRNPSLAHMACRFDVLAIGQQEQRPKPRFDWIQAAFEAPFFS